jgi:hypothetical protein
LYVKKGHRISRIGYAGRIGRIRRRKLFVCPKLIRIGYARGHEKKKRIT